MAKWMTGRFSILTLLLTGAFLTGCASRPPTELKPNHVLIESNRAEAVPLASRYLKRRGYVPVASRSLAQNVLTVDLSADYKPYASSRFNAVEYEHRVPVSFRMVGRDGRTVWQSCAAGEAHTAAEALRLAVRDGIEGFGRHNAGYLEVIKLPLDHLFGLQRPTPLPFYRPKRAGSLPPN
jgi:hypothetical protein